VEVEKNLRFLETTKFFNKNFWRFSKFRMNFGTPKLKILDGKK